jgi:transcriptional regulator of arginine metabolism
MLMNKHSSTSRRDLLLRFVREKELHSQEELLALFRKEGVRVTQPTLSRDVRELGLVKTPSGYRLAQDIDTTPAEFSLAPAERRLHRLEQLVREYAVSVRQAASLVVIRTPVASAQPLARAIDEADLPELIGTLGGDDTILLATGSSADAARLVRRFEQILQPRRSRRSRSN